MNAEVPSGGGQGREKAFTLIELLVVIAIVAILLSVLLPALSGTKRATQSAACKTRLHQIGIALGLYTTDFGVYPNVLEKVGRYLVQNRVEVVRTNGNATVHLLPPTPFQCPTKLSYWLNLYGSLAWPQDQDRVQTNNSLGLALTCPTDPVYGPYLAEKSVAVPSDMFASGDTTVSGWVEPIRDPCFGRGLHFRPQYVHRPSQEHPDVGVANMLFCDGHVQEGRKSVWEARTDIARRRWNRDHLPHAEQFTD
jgi:prepilin-type N-terminal cleavage/methylation domain-containing protein/prepilin-type processing-associated H-X9-DG protein